jgi:photosystem II stability/assembly factor-like uncharacterized protein
MYSFKTFFSVILFCSIQFIYAAEQFSPEYATFSSLADKSLLLAADSTGSVSVVVGERGHILYSHDNENWEQALVETKVTLTNVFMLNENIGWAVGHDAFILRTTDGAATWKKQFFDINEEAPLLDIYFKDELNGFAIGAYSLMYVTNDGGLNWNKTDLNFSNKDLSNDNSVYTDIYDIHLNALAFAGDKRLYIAAEAGHVLRSDDEGKTWLNLTSPYRGSFFGILPLSYDDVLVYGLRGHLYHSSDAGESWQQIGISSNEMLTDAKLLSNGNIIISGLAGTLLVSKDQGQTFLNVNLNHRHGLTSILEKEDGSLILTSEDGIKTISLEH